MLFCDWAGNTLAERFGSSQYNIKYLIDSEGNVSKPQFSSSYWYNVDQGFGSYYPINLASYYGNGNISQNYTTTVYESLRKLETVLYSSTGSLGTDYLVSGSYSSINISALNEYLTNLFNVSVNNNISPQNITSSAYFTTASFQTVVVDKQGGWSTSLNKFTMPVTSPLISQCQVSITFENLDLSNSANIFVYFYVGSNSNSTFDSVVAGGSKNITITLNEVLQPGQEVWASVKSTRNCNLTSNLTITPLTNNLITSTPFFTNGNNSRNVLTSSLDLGLYYGGGYSQNSIDNSGFDKPLPWILNINDEIRFESNENNVFSITSIYQNPSTNLLYLTLNSPVPSGLNLNDFSIRRLVPDPGFIIVNNVPISQTGPSPVFITPKYPTPALKANMNKIITDLSSKGLI